MTFADAFFAHLAEGTRARLDGAAVEAWLGELHRRGRDAWPAVALPPALFARHVGERAGDVEALDELSGPGLYLACACLHGDPMAVRAFRDTFAPEMVAVVARMDARDLADEITQSVLDGLFVARGERPPGIAGYRGRGELRAWVRVVTVRQAYSTLRAQRKSERREHLPSDEAQLERAMGARDPELDRLKAAYRSKFKQAFEHAFQALPARDRTLLRYQFLDGLRLEQIGLIYDVSRATAARWIAQARGRLLRGTQSFMRRELDVTRGELDSVMNLIESQLEVSITRLLRQSRSEP